VHELVCIKNVEKIIHFSLQNLINCAKKNVFFFVLSLTENSLKIANGEVKLQFLAFFVFDNFKLTILAKACFNRVTNNIHFIIIRIQKHMTRLCNNL
jgi:hypothetical protein